MVCQACGSAVEQGGKFCPHCGAQVVVAAAPPPGPPPQYAGYTAYAPIPYIPRVQRHLQSLGTLWCIYALYRICIGLLGLFFFRAVTWNHRWNSDWPLNRWGDWGHGWMHLMPFFIAMMITASLFGLFVGYSLLTRQTWGRVLAIVAGVLVLFKPLLGTALGIYTLWVMAPSTSGLEYDSMVDAGYPPGMPPPH
jgi:hypothetical protein